MKYEWSYIIKKLKYAYDKYLIFILKKKNFFHDEMTSQSFYQLKLETKLLINVILDTESGRRKQYYVKHHKH